jgi:hypothetical protein
MEANRFDAFVTFFHPSSKYSGPRTDGIFNRNVFFTALSAIMYEIENQKGFIL